MKVTRRTRALLEAKRWARERSEMMSEAFTCPRCGRTSHNPNDKREGWCGACQDQTAGVAQVPAANEDAIARERKAIAGAILAFHRRQEARELAGFLEALSRGERQDGPEERALDAILVMALRPDARPITEATSENERSVALERDDRSGPIMPDQDVHQEDEEEPVEVLPGIAKIPGRPRGFTNTRRGERRRRISSVAKGLGLEEEVVERVFAAAEKFVAAQLADDLPKSGLERALGRARELEHLGTQCAEDEKAHGREKAYELYGIRSFPVADGLGRYDVPLLADEIKRLRGWS